MSLHDLALHIEKDSPVPIYIQLYQGVTALIASGSLKPGDAIPSETDFSRHFSISPMTVRQAMTELVNQGYIRRERGRGSFVAPRQLDHPLDRMVGFSEDMQSRHFVPGAKVLLLQTVAAPEQIAKAGGIPTGTPLLRLKRVRYANHEAVGIHDAYLHNIEISEADLRKTPSLYMLLAQRGVVLTEGVDTIDAVPADDEAAELLNVKLDAPLLQTTRISWDVRNRFVEYVVAQYRADLYHYRIRLRRS
jgi:GntR family transcriptional regulator